MTLHVVAWGPNRQVAGALIEEPERAAAARRGGAVLLRVDRARHVLAPTNGASGWAKREFGHTGIRPPESVPSRFCPIAIWIDPSTPFVHWAVELMDVEPDPEMPGGTLRLAADTSQRGTIAPEAGSQGPVVGVSQLAWTEHGRDETGLFAVAQGVLRAQVSIEGLLGLSLYGAGTGFAVRRIAVSASASEEP